MAADFHRLQDNGTVDFDTCVPSRTYPSHGSSTAQLELASVLFDAIVSFQIARSYALHDLYGGCADRMAADLRRPRAINSNARTSTSTSTSNAGTMYSQERRVTGAPACKGACCTERGPTAPDSNSLPRVRWFFARRARCAPVDVYARPPPRDRQAVRSPLIPPVRAPTA